MTIQEAIERFEYVKANATHQKDAGISEYWQQEIDATIEAINMAIEALQNADRTTESTGYNLSPVEDEPQKDCKKCKNYDRCKNNRWKCCVYQPKDEPQTDCAWK